MTIADRPAASVVAISPSLLDRAYGDLTRTAAGLDDDAAARPTRAGSWTVRELLHHQLLDAQRALMALACTTAAGPDVDALTYWHVFRPGGAGAARTAEFSRRAAAAYDGHAGLVAQWSDTAAAVVRAARAADPTGRHETQGHVLALADLLSTLVVEATVHHLDLVLELTDPGPSRACLAHTRLVLEGILGGPLPAAWSDRDAVLRGTGRVELTPQDRATLGADAGRIPLLG